MKDPITTEVSSTTWSRYCERFSARLLASVSDSGCALKFTVVALVALALAYFLIHLVPHKPDPQYFSKAIAVSEDGQFRCYYRDDILDRFFARNTVNEWKQRMDEKGTALRDEALLHRATLLGAVQEFVQNTLGEQAILTRGWTTGTNAGYNLLSINLPLVTTWLEKQDEALQPAKRGILSEFISQLKAQNKTEVEQRNRLVAEINGLKDKLSFDWFFIDSWTWIIEVFFWCSFGVLANTFITLIYAIREGRYDPKEFLLVVPKGALAPVLALVIISWWATGLSESKINFVNLPYFLVLSFALGFVTENLYVKIKDLASLLVGSSATAAAAKLEAAQQHDVYHYVHPNVSPAALPPASNLDTLREQLRNAAKAGMERGIVAQLSTTTKPKS